MRIDVLSLFPEVLEPALDYSIMKRAQQNGCVSIHFTNIRDFASDRHRSVDDRPFGGGPGMIMSCGPVFSAVDHVLEADPTAATLILLSPQGCQLDQALVRELAEKPRLALIAGHYEGFDERIRVGLRPRPIEISIGDYVLTGGELPALVLIDAVVRLLPGALGDETSALDESFSNGQLEYPQYTRPRCYKGMDVPDVLLSGNHSEIEQWRRRMAQQRTQQRRPDLPGSGNATQ